MAEGGIVERLVFVDTSAWIGAFVGEDQHNPAAERALEGFLQEDRPLVTTDYIFDETVTRVRLQGGHAEAVEVGDRILKSERVKWVNIDRDLWQEAWRIFQKCKDQKFSFTDCTSFATMKRFRITEAFSFDSDFRNMGYTTLPGSG